MDAVDAARLVTAALDRTASTRLPAAPVQVIAAGKAAIPMFRAAAESLPPGARAIVAGPGETGTPPGSGVQAFAAGHPAPTSASVAAGEQALRLAEECRGEALLVLLSGGASAMLAAPARGVTLAEKTATARRLMEAGAAIDELNCVRKHLSRIKGGQLAAAAAGATLTLALSDVHAPVADDPSVIGSGPTVADPTTFADALDVVRHRGVEVPPAVRAHLERGARGESPETVKPGDPRLSQCEFVVIGNRQTAVTGAAAAARRLGYTVVAFDDPTTGEAAEAGRTFASRALTAAASIAGPVCVVGSGETTVTVRGPGRGGRNQEFAMGAASPLAERPAGAGRAAVIGSAGTDGIDGPTDAAGAVVDAGTFRRAGRQGLDPATFLARNDTYAFFDTLGDLVRWGPTGTNVGDVHVLLLA